jgi:hypothetical protein
MIIEVFPFIKNCKTIKQLNEESMLESIILYRSVKKFEKTYSLFLKWQKYFSILNPENK